MSMQNFELDTIFDSFAYNGLRILGDLNYQLRVWVNGEGPEVDSFEDSIGFILEYSEVLFEKSNQLSESRKKYLEKITDLNKKVESFYHDIFYKNPNLEIKHFIQLSEWKDIQTLANNLYQNIKEESWWTF